MILKDIKGKIARLRRGGYVRVLDLFAGCGGLSLGFHTAGFKIVGSVESDPIAVRSHAINFHKDVSENERDIHSTARDIINIEPKELVSELKLGQAEKSIDVIIGGPPCQAFARVGRAKLREVEERPEAFLEDPRSNLYLRYLHYVKKLQPLALLVENVPDVLNFGGHNISEEICDVLTDLGYVCGYTLLNSVYYGVPQMRERMFLIAYTKELEVEVTFPSPARWIDLPKGYYGSRQVALKNLTYYVQKDQQTFFDNQFFYQPPPAPTPDLKPAVTAKNALGDLPPITLHLEGKLKRGARRFDKKIPYTKNNLSNYARLIKNWPGFENEEGIADHVIRYLPRDYDIFHRMNPGDQYPEARRHALDLLQEKLEKMSRKGVHIKPSDEEYEELKKKTVPPYDPNKFPNKWRKMEADLPARTLMAHLGKDSYSHIHYNSEQARTISVREAARLQSFPDGFIFEGTMNSAFRQIGNAVPPVMAWALATEMMNQLGGRKCQKNTLSNDLLHLI